MGFNSINIIINTVGVAAMNYVKNNSQGQNSAQFSQTSVNAQGVLQTAQAANSTQTLNTSSFSPLNYTQSANSNLTSALTSVNQTLISTVEIEQRANYIKDLLSLPRDFQTLINQIQTTNNGALAKSFAALLVDGKINLNALTELMTGNSKEAVQKLMTTIMTVSKMGSNNVSQLKELMGMFSVASNSTDTAQTVKNLLMLYLPWLPLSVRNDMNLDFDIDIFDKIEGADPNKEENIETIKILIETANYGNVLAELELAKNFEIEVFISAMESFPEDEVLKRFNKETKQNSIRSNIKIEKTKDKETVEKKRNVEITSSNYVSPKLIQAAHSLIKIIIDVDYSNFIINEENEE